MDIKTYGDYPIGDVLLASCDSKYFIEHAPAFMRSAIKFKQNLHIHIVNPTDEVKQYKNKCSNFENLTFSSEQTDLSNVDARTYYACNRFIVAPYLLQYANKAMILDVDNYLMNSFRWPDGGYDAGLFLRDPLPGTVGWEQESTHVAAGIVYLNMKKPETLSFAVDVSDRIRQAENFVWFLDQNVLWKAYNDWKDKISFYKFERHIMDWEFKNGTMLWTGKGDRKHSDETYVGQKNKYTKEFNESCNI